MWYQFIGRVSKQAKMEEKMPTEDRPSAADKQEEDSAAAESFDRNDSSSQTIQSASLPEDSKKKYVLVSVSLKNMIGILTRHLSVGGRIGQTLIHSEALEMP